MNFSDNFSIQSKDYAAFRPSYPKELYTFLNGLVTKHEAAWDCATGNGQAARDLLPYFKTIYATDASSEQIANAVQIPGIQYSVATAENSGLADSTINLVTVAQALHWLDQSRFYQEARRVLQPSGVIACWGYGHISPVDTDIKAVTDTLSRDILGPYWDKRTELVFRGYETVEIPFKAIPAPDFYISSNWTYAELVGYFTSNSATQSFIKARGYHPIEELKRELILAWGDPTKIHHFKTRLTLKVGRM